MIVEKDDKINDDFVKIYANTDARMKELGQTLKTPKSRKIYQILMDKELHTKEIGVILTKDESDTPSQKDDKDWIIDKYKQDEKWTCTNILQSSKIFDHSSRTRY